MQGYSFSRYIPNAKYSLASTINQSPILFIKRQKYSLCSNSEETPYSLKSKVNTLQHNPQF